MPERFSDRREAGRELASKLTAYAGREDVLVLALPRGGVPVGFEVASALGAPFDVYQVRKLGVPGQEELAMGAIASGGVRVLNQEVVSYLRIPQSVIDAVAEREKKEIERRERIYRGDHPPPEIEGRTVILIDDGLATGASMRAAVESIRHNHPERIVVAVPVAPRSTYFEFRDEVDDVVCVLLPEVFDGVGRWYVDFSQTNDEEVRSLLDRARRKHETQTGDQQSTIER